MFAGVRSADDAGAPPAIAPGRITPVTLDITDDAQVAVLARVALVEPAQTDTDLWRHAEDELDSTSAQLSEETAGSMRATSRAFAAPFPAR